MAAPSSSAASVIRGIKVATPLGDEAFTVRAFRYREAIGEPFEGVVDVVSSSLEVDVGSLLGETITVSVPLPSGGRRYFSGICLEARQTGRLGDTFGYRFLIVPWLRLLALTSDCQIFQQQTPTAIITQVFDNLGFSDYTVSGVVGRLPTLEYCVQYDETSLNFVNRLSQRFGIGYYTEHSSGTTLWCLPIRTRITGRFPATTRSAIPRPTRPARLQNMSFIGRPAAG
jgi:type VI secretion system secreted protein VgrG